jgi:hypothetical protein
LCKYADDINLSVPESADVSVDREFINLMEWTEASKLIIDIDKPKKWFFIDLLLSKTSLRVKCVI